MSEQMDFPKPEASPTDFARAYVKLGWEPLVLPAKSKKSTRKWRNPRTWSDNEIDREFGESSNVGVALGERSGGLIDIDFDCPEAAHFGRLLLSSLPCFGRSSSPESHRVVISQLSKNRLAYQLPRDIVEASGAARGMILEIRGNGHQTMFPPSVHPSGELVEWSDDAVHIPQMVDAQLLKSCGLIAALSVITMFYPRESGERNEIAMAITGLLARTDLSDETVDALVSSIAEFAGDEEAGLRGGRCKDTREKIANGDRIWGLPELCQRLGFPTAEKTLRKWFGLRPSQNVRPDDTRPVIKIEPGFLHEQVDQAEAALLKANIGVYQRGEELVRVIRLPHSIGEGGVRRASGTLLIKPISATWLRENLGRVCQWTKETKRETKHCDAPFTVASVLLARVGEWNAPVLNGVISTPTLRPDGSILQKPGYDVATGLLFEPGDQEYPTIPECPSKQDAEVARDVLLKPFRDFDLAGESERSVLLSAILTALVRRTLSAAPLFAIDAPTAGSGKSLICETVGILATGHKPSMMSQGKSPEEDEKRLSSVLMAGDAVLVIDNCDRALGGDTICTMLTQEFITARILGKSEVTRLPTNTLVMATGNNLEILGDLSRRTLVCRIDTGEERPDTIPHDFDPRTEVLENRGNLVVAGLTILRAYLSADLPFHIPAMGSFEEWNLIREAICWIGEADPADTRDRLFVDDPQKGDLFEVLELWDKAIGSEPVTLSEIVERTNGVDYGPMRDLYSALEQRTFKGKFNARSVGRYLNRNKDRVVGGRYLHAVDDPSGVKRYALASTADNKIDDIPF